MRRGGRKPLPENAAPLFRITLTFLAPEPGTTIEEAIATLPEHVQRWMRLMADYTGWKCVGVADMQHHLRPNERYAIRQQKPRTFSPSPTPEQVGEMRRLREEGLTLAEIGKQMGYAPGTVSNYLRGKAMTQRPSIEGEESVDGM